MGKRSKLLRKRRREAEMVKEVIAAAAASSSSSPSTKADADRLDMNAEKILCSTQDLIAAINLFSSRVQVLYFPRFRSFRLALRPMLQKLHEKYASSSLSSDKKKRKMVPTKISNHHHSGLTVHVGDRDVANLIFAKVGGRAGLARHCSLLQSVLPEIMSKRFRDLRACLRPLLSEFVRESKCSASTQMTHALQDKRYKDAMCLVRGMRRARTPPKLGCVQRWVREVMDAAGASLDNPTTLQLLDAVMRLQPVTWSWMVSSTTAVATEHKVVERREVETARSSSNLLRCGIFRPPTSSSTTIEPPACNDETPRAERLDLETKQRTRRRCEYNVVLRQKGRDRRPENRFDLTIYTTKSNCIDFDADFDDPTVQRRVDVPNIPGAFVVTNVLSPAECEQIITIAESSPSGFVSDEPLTGPRVESSPPSRRAKNFVWLSRVLSERLFSRCRRHMPQAMGPRKQHLLPPRDGLNARLRLYRYYVGSEYRPHVDGSWPGSGLRGVRRESTHCSDDDDDDVDERENKSTEYVYDAFGDRWSRLTAVFYLNDDMCGGHTVFYTPASTEGVIEARGVVPRRGSVLLFPHGGSVGSLVHEGGALTRGEKYIIRTDVLYTVPGHERSGYAS